RSPAHALQTSDLERAAARAGESAAREMPRKNFRKAGISASRSLARDLPLQALALGSVKDLDPAPDPYAARSLPRRTPPPSVTSGDLVRRSRRRPRGATR